MAFRTGRMSPAAFAAHMKAHTPADATPLPVSSVPAIDPAARIAEVVTRACALDMPKGGEMAALAVESFRRALPAEGATLAKDGLLTLSAAVGRLATCHRMAGRYDAEKACDSVRNLADTVYRIV